MGSILDLLIHITPLPLFGCDNCYDEKMARSGVDSGKNGCVSMPNPSIIPARTDSAVRSVALSSSIPVCGFVGFPTSRSSVDPRTRPPS